MVEKQMLRSPIPLALSALVLLVLAACAEQEAAAPPLPASAPAPLSSDQNFIDRAALGTSTEVELGRLARTRALSPAVRAFADRIITDHRQAHARLRTLERRLQMAAGRVTLPPNRLTTLSGEDFDRQFMADQVQNHREAIQLFQDEARMGQDPRLRKYATDNLPMLHRNLQEAEAIRSRLGS
jgi:putative membrane protein